MNSVCLARAIGEVYKMLDNRLLERALHRTQNLHTAEWNMNVVRKSLHLLSYKAIQFQELYNTRIAYQAFEQFDMMGMFLNQHVILNTLRMCNRNIAPMKLANRIKHMKDNFEEKGRIQLHEFLDLKYEDFSLDKIEYSEGKDTKDMFKLVNFEKLLSHHDQRLAVKLNNEYLKEEWDFGFEKFSSKKMFKEPPIVCAEERMQQARQNKIAYRDLKSEVAKSRKMVYKARAGYVRERPLTAPDLSKYIRQDVKGEEEISEEKLINVMQQRNVHFQAQDLQVPNLQRGSKYQINKEVLQSYYIPNHKNHSDSITEEGSVEISVKSSPRIPKPSKEEIIQNLAYPKPLLPPSHARICDARFRGWSDVSKKKGAHFILAEHSFENSYKGLLHKKQMKQTNSVVNHIHGDFLYRKTKKNDVTKQSNKNSKRPLTAPSSRESVEVENQEEITDVSPTDSNKTVDTGYGSGDEKSEKEVHDKPEDEIEEPKPLMAWKSETNLLDEKLFLNLENTNKKETNRQEKRRNTYAEGEIQTTKNVNTKDTNRKEVRRNTLAEGENLTKKSKCSAKEKHKNENSFIAETITNFNEVFANDVPIPQMEHAKPKMVNVGGIGTISLLESITEAKSLEDLYDDDVSCDQGFQDNGQEMVSDIYHDSGHEGKENDQNILFIDNNQDAVKTKKKRKVRKAISDQFFGNSLVLEKLAKEKERRMKKRNGSQSQTTKTMKKYEKLEKDLKKQDKSLKQESVSSQSKNVDKKYLTTNTENKLIENENFGNFKKKKIKCEKTESSRAKTSLGQIQGLDASDVQFENFDDIRPQTTSTCSGNYDRLVKRVSGQISNELTNRLLTLKS
ncbi:hypothetical protein KUTeg_022646 [Tegillarca granosa]|uniref:Uncharacterized protein n=1 Tax=Tegillarca granosa TaxID=220873 RepID=A0ABQ9E4B2_TEGGR|nr:hypothetical protein KUTeg_022646 [Tegillarca granosa]